MSGRWQHAHKEKKTPTGMTNLNDIPVRIMIPPRDPVIQQNLTTTSEDDGAIGGPDGIPRAEPGTKRMWKDEEGQGNL